MDQQEINLQLQAKTLAIHVGLAQGYALLYELMGLSPAEIRRRHAIILARLARETFPQYGPAWSDHYAALVEEEMRNFLTAVEMLVIDDPQS